MTIAEVAKALGKSPNTIRMGLRHGKYPFGTGFKLPGHKTYNYTLYPKKVAEYMEINGYNDVEGNEDEETVHNSEKQSGVVHE